MLSNSILYKTKWCGGNVIMVAFYFLKVPEAKSSQNLLNDNESLINPIEQHHKVLIWDTGWPAWDCASILHPWVLSCNNHDVRGSIQHRDKSTVSDCLDFQTALTKRREKICNCRSVGSERDVSDFLDFADRWSVSCFSSFIPSMLSALDFSDDSSLISYNKGKVV